MRKIGAGVVGSTSAAHSRICAGGRMRPFTANSDAAIRAYLPMLISIMHIVLIVTMTDIVS